VLLKAMSLKLSAAGFEVLTAADSSDAITAMRDFNPQLIILDLNFPPDIYHPSGMDWDGFKLMSWLRLLEAKAVPVIVITAGEADDYRQPALAAGAFAFFQKPFPPSTLLAAVEKALEDRQNLRPDQPRFDTGI
jgi:DNA-binding response OmpR family regulator